ncbi:MAG: hypothetical protein KDA65_03830 [Planctomycetaceae bacterium]|nr:hypothetical protein [Planctomycetaceae bacterium]
MRSPRYQWVPQSLSIAGLCIQIEAIVLAIFILKVAVLVIGVKIVSGFKIGSTLDLLATVLTYLLGFGIPLLLQLLTFYTGKVLKSGKRSGVILVWVFQIIPRGLLIGFYIGFMLTREKSYLFSFPVLIFLTIMFTWVSLYLGVGILGIKHWQRLR